MIQGGGSRELRQECAAELLAIGFDGFGYGGWPLDDDGNLLGEMLAYTRELVPAELWRKRYRHIVEFERTLADHRTIVLKFFLHISRREQEERLLAREQEVEKAWKLSAGDWEQRELWDAYTAAYSDAIRKTNTGFAPQ